MTEAFRLLYFGSYELGADIITEDDRYWYSYCCTHHFSRGGYNPINDDCCPDNWEKYS